MQVPTRIDFSFVIDFYRETVAEQYTPAQKNAVRTCTEDRCLGCSCALPPPPSVRRGSSALRRRGTSQQDLAGYQLSTCSVDCDAAQVLRHFLDLFVAPGVPQEQLTAAIKYIIIPIIQVPTISVQFSSQKRCLMSLPWHTAACRVQRLLRVLPVACGSHGNGMNGTG